MRIAVLGSTGMAGSMVSHYLKQKGHEVTRFAKQPLTGFFDKLLNVHNKDQMNNFVEHILLYAPDAIINCIGYLVKDSDKNPAEAIFLNSYLPHLLENITNTTNTKVIHLSTDCIFDGSSFLGYNEDDKPTETNWYGRSKALGELNNNKDLTLRQSIIGPAPQANNTGLFNWIYSQKETTVEGYTHVAWNGITTLELAKQIETILLKKSDLSGIYHLVTTHVTNKWQLLTDINKIWKLNNRILMTYKPDSDKFLYNNRQEEYDPKIPTYIEQFTELHDYMKKYDIGVGYLK